jgi:hypothetical protein
MLTYIVDPASAGARGADKKMMVTLPQALGPGHVIYFGAAGAEDYTTHRDPARRASYIARHRPREDWGDPTTPGFWSRWLLWEEPTLRAALASVAKRLNARVLWRP